MENLNDFAYIYNYNGVKIKTIRHKQAITSEAGPITLFDRSWPFSNIIQTYSMRTLIKNRLKVLHGEMEYASKRIL